MFRKVKKIELRGRICAVVASERFERKEHLKVLNFQLNLLKYIM